MNCDECGREITNAHRVYKWRRYCATCYARVFKLRLCPRCGNLARLPKDDEKAVCRKCEKDKPCIRCGKPEYEVGKITPYGPVCNSCAPHFREPKPCGQCGSLSSRLTRVKRIGIEVPVCPKCARQDHGTCQTCHRHRSLQESSDGRLLCGTCLEKGEVLCPKCGELMPAGNGKQCQKCYWKGLLEKRIEMDSAAFSVTQMATNFEAFGRWLGQETGEHKAAMTIHRYLPFFLEIERRWKTIPEYGKLLAHFGALRLRRVLLPMRWMEENGYVVPDTAAKEEDSERRRIAATLDKFPRESRERAILEGYHNVLMMEMKADNTTLRSIRLAMTPAAAFVLRAKEMKSMPPDQKTLDAYMEKTPGQRAAVSGFVRYLRDVHGAKISLPRSDSKKAQRNRRKKLEAEMLVLMRTSNGSEEFRRQWLSVALAYFHGLPRKVGRRIQTEGIGVHEDGSVTVTWNGQKYWIPKHIPYDLNLIGDTLDALAAHSAISTHALNSDRIRTGIKGHQTDV